MYLVILDYVVEPICCKKQQKKVPNQLLVCGIGDLNDSKLTPSDSPDHQGSILYHSELQRSPIPQTRNWPGTFFCCFLQQTGSKSLLP